MFEKQEYWKYLARSKLFHPNETQKLAHAQAPSVLLFLIGTLQGLKSSCSNLFEKLRFLKCFTELSVRKTRILEIFAIK